MRPLQCLVQLFQVDAAVVVQIKFLEGIPHDILLVKEYLSAFWAVVCHCVDLLLVF